MAEKEKKIMPENNSEIMSQLSFTQELVAFFDDNDMGEHISQMLEANFDIAITGDRYLASVILSFCQ